MWFISLDTETTGLNPDLHEVIELKATALARDLATVGVFYAKIKMLHPEVAETKALEINKYAERDWTDAQPPAEVYAAFARWLADMESKICYLGEYRSRSPIPLGQNPGFDVDMVVKNAARFGIPLKFSYHRFDIVSLSMLMDILRSQVEPNFVWQPTYSLEPVAKAYGVHSGISHTADADESMHRALLQLYIEKIVNGLHPVRPSFLRRVWSWLSRENT
jgi:DNA polymerase III epsilon subunit-like protein